MKNSLISSIFLISVFVLNGIQQINVFYIITLPNVTQFFSGKII